MPRILARTWPTFWRSMPLIMISVWLGVSIVMPSGIGKFTACEKPSVRFSALPCTAAR